jgi:hypothetical protein
MVQKRFKVQRLLEDSPDGWKCNVEIIAPTNPARVSMITIWLIYCNCRISSGSLVGID